MMYFDVVASNILKKVFNLKSKTMKIKLFIIILTFSLAKCLQAQILSKIEPDSVRYDQPVELRIQFSRFNFNKNLKPLIYFTTKFKNNEEIKTISEENYTVVNDSTIKYLFNKNALLLSDSVFDLNISNTNNKEFNGNNVWRNALKTRFKPSTSNLKLTVENLPDTSKTNPNNFPSSIFIRVKYPNKNSYFTDKSTQVLLKSNFNNSIAIDSFTVINDSLMDVYFTLNSKVQKADYYLEVNNDKAFKLLSNSVLYLYGNVDLYYTNIFSKTISEYKNGDTALQYTFGLNRKIDQAISDSNAFKLTTYLNNSISKNTTITLSKMSVDTVKISPNEKILRYYLYYKIDIDTNAKQGIYSFNFQYDSIGENWFYNIFKVIAPKIEIDESINFPEYSETIAVYCGNKIPFNVPTSFRFLKNNIPTNEIKIDTVYYNQNATKDFRAFIKYTSLSESNGKYDIEITNENIDTIIVPQILTISEFYPNLLWSKNYIFNKGDTVKNYDFQMFNFRQIINDTLKLQNLKPLKNGLESKEIKFSNIKNYYNNQAQVDIIINEKAESGWYDISFDTAAISRNFVQKSAFYICNSEIKSFSPSIISGSGQEFIDFKVNFSKTNFTKAKNILLKIEDPYYYLRYAITDFNVINDTTVVFKLIFNNEQVDNVLYLPIIVYNDYDGYAISRNKLQIEVAPFIYKIEPTWAEKEKYTDIYLHTSLTSFTQLNPQFISPIFYKNNKPLTDIWVISRPVINDSTLKVTLFPSANTDGEYEIGIYQNQNNLNYTNRKKFSVSKTNNQNIDFNNDFKIFPNPTTNILNVQWEGFKNNSFSIQISDLAGKIIFETHKPIVTLDLNSILSNKGMYFISLRTKDGVVTKKFVFN